MAKATAVFAPPGPVKPVLKEVVLTLTVAEANALWAVFRYVGGSPRNTRRRLINDINDALYVAGITYPTEGADDIDRRAADGIYFKEPK